VLRERGALLPALGLLDVLPPAPLLAGPHRGRCADAIPAPQRARSPPATSCSRGPRSRAQLATLAQCGRGARSIADQRHSPTARSLQAPRSTIELSSKVRRTSSGRVAIGCTIAGSDNAHRRSLGPHIHACARVAHADAPRRPHAAHPPRDLPYRLLP
jgi:hypothetical protein